MVLRHTGVYLLASLALLIGATSTADAKSAADDIVGVWQTKSGGYVQIYRDGSSYDGRIVGSTDGKPRYDQHNPEPAKKGRRLLGVVILQHLKADGDKTYDDGTIYDPHNGKTYSAKARLSGPDRLDARGYIGVSLIGKTQTWHRIAPDAEHVHQDLLARPAGAAPTDGS